MAIARLPLRPSASSAVSFSRLRRPLTWTDTALPSCYLLTGETAYGLMGFHPPVEGIILFKLGKHRRTGERRSLIRTVVMLCLVAHAGLATVTHHHGGSNFVSPATNSGAELSRGSNPNGPRQTSKETCCVLCSFQRNFATEVRQVSISLDFPSERVNSETSLLEPIARGVSLVLSSRAPPLA